MRMYSTEYAWRISRQPLDISPFCLYHNVPMMIAQAERDPERILDPIYYWYVCSVRGCHLRYDTEHGYHGTTDDELDSLCN
jgi:hypothetical protein